MQSLQKEIESLASAMLTKIMSDLQESVAQALRKSMLDLEIAQSPPKASTAKKHTKSPRPPRDTALLAKLRDDLLEQVKVSPGEPMQFYGQNMNLPGQELSWPMRSLIAEKKIKKVGERARARYFALEIEMSEKLAS